MRPVPFFSCHVFSHIRAVHSTSLPIALCRRFTTGRLASLIVGSGVLALVALHGESLARAACGDYVVVMGRGAGRHHPLRPAPDLREMLAMTDEDAHSSRFAPFQSQPVPLPCGACHSAPPGQPFLPLAPLEIGESQKLLAAHHAHQLGPIDSSSWALADEDLLPLSGLRGRIERPPRRSV